MQWDPVVRQFYAAVFNRFYDPGITLGTWELADAIQLDKNNGKLGTKSKILIMMLDPLGKAYYWLLHGLTVDIRRPFGYGFYDKA